jgi:hypothetical protein
MTVNQEFKKLYMQLNIDFYMNLVEPDAKLEDFLKP